MSTTNFSLTLAGLLISSLFHTALAHTTPSRTTQPSGGIVSEETGKVLAIHLTDEDATLIQCADRLGLDYRLHTTDHRPDDPNAACEELAPAVDRHLFFERMEPRLEDAVWSSLYSVEFRLDEERVIVSEQAAIWLPVDGLQIASEFVPYAVSHASFVAIRQSLMDRFDRWHGFTPTEDGGFRRTVRSGDRYLEASRFDYIAGEDEHGVVAWRSEVLRSSRVVESPSLRVDVRELCSWTYSDYFKIRVAVRVEPVDGVDDVSGAFWVTLGDATTLEKNTLDPLWIDENHPLSEDNRYFHVQSRGYYKHLDEFRIVISDIEITCY